MTKVNQSVYHQKCLLRILLIALGILKPLLELLGRLADALARLQVHVLLAGLGAPRLQDLLGNEVVLVVFEQDGRDLRNKLGLVVADKALSATQEGLFVLLRSDHLLEHRSTPLDLFDDLLGEESLRDDGQSAVLRLDTKLLCLDVDFDVVELIDAALLRGCVDDPLAEDIVTRATFAVLVILNDKSALEIVGKVLGTSPDGFLGSINVPLDFLGLFVLDLFGALVDLTSELVVTASLNCKVTFLTVLLCTVTGAASVGRTAVTPSFSLFASTTLSLLVGLVLLALLGLVLEDEGAQLQAAIDVGDLTAGFAVKGDVAVLDVDVGFGVLALLAEDKLGNETVEIVLELAGVVGAVDDPAVVVGVCVGLGSEFKAEILDDVSRRAGERLGDAAEVDDDSLDAIALAFNLGLDPLHLVAVEGVGDIATDIDGGHGDGCGGRRGVKVITSGAAGGRARSS